jgi:3-(3-hydroxy-phenyl)propionate hydroxylase
MAFSRPILVAGAGPGGLALAVLLAQRGVEVIVVEREAELAHDLRAGTYHPPTVEMFDRLGIGDEIRVAGIAVRRWQIRDRRDGLVAEFDLGLLADATPYPFRLHCEQHKLTPMLARRLAALAPGALRFATSLVDAADRGDRVAAVVEGEGGRETVEAEYLVGADGAKSAVRKVLGVEFEGFTWPERYLVASTPRDLAPHGFAMNAYIADPDEWCAIFKMPHRGPPGLWRLAFPIPPEIADADALADGFVDRKLAGFVPALAGAEIAYRGIYAVHQRVAKTFRVGRALLLGDAAHINNPLGGMGLNSSIHDAVNLGDKLAALADGAETDADALLERYVRQRRGVNIEFVQSISIRNKRLLEERDPAIRRARLDELRETAADPAKARAHLLRTSMIESVRRAAEIA